MRHFTIAFAVSAALSVGVSHAAPGFGASSHRLGGDGAGSKASASKNENAPWDLLTSLAALAGFDLSGSVEPVAVQRISRKAADRKECENAKGTEVAKAEPKQGGGNTPTKPRGPSGEPIYLAF